jgi:hypothetical protein
MRTDCHRHLLEPASDVCGACAQGFCRECLVYPFGKRAAPLCLACATRAAGLRQGAVPSSGRTGRRHRALVEERRAQLRALRDAS